MRMLENVHWTPSWTSLIGCIKACSDAMGHSHPIEWIFGGTGHAFLLHLGDSFCPSNPTAWNKEKLFQLCENLGIKTIRICQEDGKNQEDAWNSIRESIDAGRPAYAWELKHFEFYTIYGYDETGYYYKGPGAEDGEGPFAWKQLGKKMGLWVFVPELCEVQPEEKVFVDALSFAVELDAEPTKWTFFPNARTGIGAYRNWIKAVETLNSTDYKENSKGLAIAYNVAVWSECRQNAVAFLELAGKRLGITQNTDYGGLLDSYASVAASLKKISTLFPFDEKVWDENSRNNVLLSEMKHHVSNAMAKEEIALSIIPKVIGCIQN